MIITSFPPRVGGGELQTALQARTMARMGHQVTVIDPILHRGVPMRAVRDGLRIERVPAPDIPLLEGFVTQARLGLRLWRLLRQTDVVHFNHLSPTLWTIWALCRLRRCPLVVCVWGSSRPGIGPFGPGWRHALSRAVARRADRIVALGSETADHLLRWRFPADRLVQISNGIDLDALAPGDRNDEPPEGAPEGSPRIVTVGRLVPAKALTLLLQAWTRVVERLPGAVLAIIGDGPEADSLRRQVEALGLSASVHLAGTRRDIPRWLAWADAYVSCSRSEGMSNAILEALGAGLPVLATRVGGAADVITDGENGLLIEPDSLQALESGLLSLLQVPERRTAMGIRARERAEQELGIEVIVSRYVDLYRSAGAGRPG